MQHGQTWSDLWAHATNELHNSDEARHVIEAASGRSGASWLITLDVPAPSGAVDNVERMIQRRLAGEPLQYVLGTWGFRQLNLKLDQRVLIPRPETEQVAEVAIQRAKAIPGPIVADLGTGSGAIALSVAYEIDDALVFACDVSAPALDVTYGNLSVLSPEVAQRVRLQQGSWYEALPAEAKGRLDVIVSNPPYVGEDERDDVAADVVKWEPHSALFSGPDGLDDIRAIIQGASAWLSPRGSLVVEIAPRQAVEVTELARRAGLDEVGIGVDFSGRQPLAGCKVCGAAPELRPLGIASGPAPVSVLGCGRANS